MKLVCKYSGIEWITPYHFRNNHRQTSIHPIFGEDIPVKYLLSRSREWAAGELSEEENKLLFLALFHKTGMLQFRCPANPSPQVVQNNMERLLRFVNWHFALSKPNLVLPSLVVTPDNSEMRNAKIWLETWEKKKQDWENGYRELTKAEKLRKKEEALDRLIMSADKKVTKYSKMLAEWVMIAANVPAELHEHWVPLFSLKDWDIYNARTADLQELLEHMEDNLDAYDGGIRAEAAFRHIRSILQLNKDGLNLGMDTDFDPSVDPITVTEKPYEFIEEAEEITRLMITKDAPLKKPSKEDFPQTPAGRMQLIRANAAYLLAQRESSKKIEVAKRIIAQEQQQLQQLNQDSLDSSHAAEEPATDSYTETELEKLKDFLANNPDEAA